MAQSPIAVVQDAPGLIIQALFQRFTAGLPPEVRVAGVIEENPDRATRGRHGARLRGLRDEVIYPIFQDLGTGTAGCRLDATGVVAACADIERDIARGVDLVVLSKFARLEADRSGLMPAFTAALASEVPILTSVAPRFAEAWDRFASPLFTVLPPEPDAIENWWRG